MQDSRRQYPLDARPSKPAQLLIDSVAAAEMLGMSTRKLWQLTKDGEIPFLRIGRSVRFSVSALEQWIESRIEGGRSDEQDSFPENTGQ